MKGVNVPLLVFAIITFGLYGVTVMQPAPNCSARVEAAHVRGYTFGVRETTEFFKLTVGETK